MRKPPPLEKMHASGAGLDVCRCFGIPAPQYFASPFDFALHEFALRLAQHRTIDAMLFQLEKNTVIAVTPDATLHQRFGKTLLGKKSGFL